MSGLPQVGVGFQPTQSVPTLEEIFAYIAQANRTCYIAIDEFQQVSEYPEKNVEELIGSPLMYCRRICITIGRQNAWRETIFR